MTDFVSRQYARLRRHDGFRRQDARSMTDFVGRMRAHPDVLRRDDGLRQQDAHSISDFLSECVLYDGFRQHDGLRRQDTRSVADVVGRDA